MPTHTHTHTHTHVHTHINDMSHTHSSFVIEDNEIPVMKEEEGVTWCDEKQVREISHD